MAGGERSHSPLSKAALTFHSIFLTTLLVGGAAFLGVGLWLQLSQSGGPVELEWTDGSGFVDAFLSLGVAAIVIGGVLLATAVFALCAVSRSCVGRVARVLFVMATLVVAAALVLLATATLLIASESRPDKVKELVRESWVRTVTSNETEIVGHACALQSEYECSGFDAGDCANCLSGVGEDGRVCTEEEQEVCPRCETGVEAGSPGCYDSIITRTRKVFLPLGVVSAVLAGLALLDIFIVCCI
ncbi:hypothetical protein MMPV_010130 [Pyropia vietnamensis]